MGTLVTLELPDDSPVLEMAWIITFGPLDEDDTDWEPVVCGPYERDTALALAEAVVMDEDLMAVVEPLLPHVSVADIHGEIAAARMAVDVELYDDELSDADLDELDDLPGIETEYDDKPDHHNLDSGTDDDDADDTDNPMRPTPSPEQVRAGFRRIASRLTGPAEKAIG